jgi:hypothetical protein
MGLAFILIACLFKPLVRFEWGPVELNDRTLSFFTGIATRRNSA